MNPEEHQLVVKSSEVLQKLKRRYIHPKINGVRRLYVVLKQFRVDDYMIYLVESLIIYYTTTNWNVYKETAYNFIQTANNNEINKANIIIDFLEGRLKDGEN